MRRRLLLLATLVAVLAAGCSSSGGSSASGPSGSGAGTTEATTATTQIRPWWIVGDKVTPGDPRTDAGADPVRAALDALFAGPTPSEASFGAGTAIAPTATINSLVVGTDGVATVDFNRKFETADTRPQTAQVVYTLTEFPQVQKVRFLIDGQPNGATGVPPVGRADLRFPAAAG